MTVYQNISFGLTNIKEEMDEIDFDARAAARMIEILQKPQDVVRAINECVDKKKKLNMDKAYLRLIDLYEISLFTAKALMGMKLHEAGDPKAAAAQEIKKLEDEARRRQGEGRKERLHARRGLCPDEGRPAGARRAQDDARRRST